jgi:hypothetical protein
VNNEKMCNLFQTVLYKQKQKEIKEKAVKWNLFWMENF